MKSARVEEVVAQAIREVGIATKEAGSSLAIAAHDAAAGVVRSVERTGAVILKALVGARPNDEPPVSWPDVDASYAKSNGGTPYRALPHKTEEEERTLRRMRSKQTKESES